VTATLARVIPSLDKIFSRVEDASTSLAPVSSSLVDEPSSLARASASLSVLFARLTDAFSSLAGDLPSLARAFASLAGPIASMDGAIATRENAIARVGGTIASLPRIFRSLPKIFRSIANTIGAVGGAPFLVAVDSWSKAERLSSLDNRKGAKIGGDRGRASMPAPRHSDEFSRELRKMRVLRGLGMAWANQRFRVQTLAGDRFFAWIDEFERPSRKWTLPSRSRSWASSERHRGTTSTSSRASRSFVGVCGVQGSANAT